jgi:hypothetical protein
MLTIHIVDNKGVPVANAKVSVNTTYQTPRMISNLSGIKDSNGDAIFGVTPGVIHDARVITADSLFGYPAGNEVVITASAATISMTVTPTILESPMYTMVTFVSTVLLAPVMIVRNRRCRVGDNKCKEKC